MSPSFDERWQKCFRSDSGNVPLLEARQWVSRREKLNTTNCGGRARRIDVSWKEGNVLPAVPSMPVTTVEALARALDGAMTHNELTVAFGRLGMPNASQGSGSKFNRLVATFTEVQRRDRCANAVLRFVQEALAPTRFIEQPERFTDISTQVNRVLAFVGIVLRDDGQLGSVTAARTIPEARQRADNLRAKLEQRGVHADVLRFCRAELLVDNYFHAVFEATKSVADKIREKSGLTSDGAQLVDQAFESGRAGCPVLAVNRFQSETDKNEHRGLANLVRGMFGMFRNVTAHEPKIKWSIDETDALDLLSLASLVHRRLDRAVRTPAIARPVIETQR